MQLLISFSVCLLLAVTTLAQRPHPCESPPLMAGSASAAYPQGQLLLYERFSYDAAGERIRARMKGRDHQQPFNEDILIIYQEGVLYEINDKNHTCQKKAFKVPFQPIKIPSNATFLAQVIIGSSSGPGEGLLVNTWTGDIPEQKAKNILTFTEIGCLPVTSLYHTDKTGWILTSFFDIVVGSVDPGEFIPPDFCDKTKPVDGVVTDFFEYFLKKMDQ